MLWLCAFEPREAISDLARRGLVFRPGGEAVGRHSHPLPCPVLPQGCIASPGISVPESIASGKAAEVWIWRVIGFLLFEKHTFNFRMFRIKWAALLMLSPYYLFLRLWTLTMDISFCCPPSFLSLWKNPRPQSLTPTAPLPHWTAGFLVL